MTCYNAFTTHSSRISFQSFSSAETIMQLCFSEQFGENRYLGGVNFKREHLIQRAAEEDANVVLAVADEEMIVGYCILASPKPEHRWSAVKSHSIMELDFVEVTVPWRRMGVGEALVKAALRHPAIEERILYAVGYRWSWDMEGTNMPASQYRSTLIRLFEPFEFKEYETNAPTVCLDASNFLLCRFGKNIAGSLRKEFKRVCMSYP